MVLQLDADAHREGQVLEGAYRMDDSGLQSTDLECKYIDIGPKVLLWVGI